MIIILETHPIQYHTPMWKELYSSNQTKFEVWYLTRQGLDHSYDKEFNASFKWDLDLLSGYPSRFITDPTPSSLGGFWDLKLPNDFRRQLINIKPSAILIQGWHFFACIKAIFISHSLGIPVWIRGDSNDLKKDNLLKSVVKKLVLGFLFKRIDKFLYVGKSTKRLYKKYKVPDDKLIRSPHAVDNDFFYKNTLKLQDKRLDIRKKWNINENSFCILFVGKFISQKNPQHIISAIDMLNQSDQKKSMHILFVGSGELEEDLRKRCSVEYPKNKTNMQSKTDDKKPMASFTGFMNQSQITEAYVAADLLILPSSSETWGLVVNEAMATGLPCVVSDMCGCSDDLILENYIEMKFMHGDINDLSKSINFAKESAPSKDELLNHIKKYSINHSVEAINGLYKKYKN